MKWPDDRGEAQGGRTGGEGKHPEGRELHQRGDDLRCSHASDNGTEWNRKEQVLLVSCFQFQPAWLRQLTVLEADVKAHNVQRYLRRGRSSIGVETPNASRPGHVMKDCYFSRQM